MTRAPKPPNLNCKPGVQDNHIPVPSHIIVSRDDLDAGDPPGFVENHDWVEMHGVRICKPFVEKPSSGEDHNVSVTCVTHSYVC